MKKGNVTVANTECLIEEIILPVGKEADQVKVMELADSISLVGLINPIVINSSKELISGFNRVEAYKLLGYTAIPANTVDTDKLTCRLIQIDEDLIRKHLDVMTLGLLLNERKALLAEMGLLAKVGDNKHTMKSGTKTTKDLAKAIGKSSRTVHRITKVVRELDPEVIDSIKGTDTADNLKALTTLSHQSKEIQVEAAKDIKEGMAPSVAIKKAHREKTQDKLKEASKLYSLPDSVQLLLGDFRDVSKDILDESIKLVIADPLYNKESIGDYRDAAKIASRVLKPGGFFIAYAANLYLNEIIKGVTAEGLSYHWTGGIFFSNGQNQEISRKMISKYRPVIFFTKGKDIKPTRYVQDVFGCGSEVDLHHYQQVLEPVHSWIISLTETEDTVLSCFLGTGTDGVACVKEFRKFIGIDFDEEMMAIAEARIKAAASEETEEELDKAA